MNAAAIKFLKRKGAYKNNLNAVELTQSGLITYIRGRLDMHRN